MSFPEHVSTEHAGGAVPELEPEADDPEPVDPEPEGSPAEVDPDIFGADPDAELAVPDDERAPEVDDSDPLDSDLAPDAVIAEPELSAPEDEPDALPDFDPDNEPELAALEAADPELSLTPLDGAPLPMWSAPEGLGPQPASNATKRTICFTRLPS
jgi:hypothetical protein